MAKLESFSFCHKKYFCSFPWKANIGCENVSWKFHINFLPSFFFFAGQFWRRSSYRVNYSYTCLQATIWKVPLLFGKENPHYRTFRTYKDNKTFSRPILLWAVTMKHIASQSIQDTAVITLSNTFCSKHLQDLSSPVLFPLCSPFQAFCPHLDNSSSNSLLFTCFITQLSSTTFAEASWVVSFSPLLKGSCDQRCIPLHICEVGFFCHSPNLSLREIWLFKIFSPMPVSKSSVPLLLQTRRHDWIGNYKGKHNVCLLIHLTVSLASFRGADSKLLGTTAMAFFYL